MRMIQSIYVIPTTNWMGVQWKQKTFLWNIEIDPFF